MASHEIEIILSRQFADCISLPVFLTDPEGNLLFYNEAAEEVLGKRFDETGMMPAAEWTVAFKPESKSGKSLSPEELPLVRTLQNQSPEHGSFWIESMRGEPHLVSVTSFPIIGRSGRYLGAVAIFWKEESS